MKNKLSDLNDHLFAQLERLNDEEIKGEEMNQEIKKAQAMSKVASQVINNAKVVLDGLKYVNSGDHGLGKAPEFLGIEK